MTGQLKDDPGISPLGGGTGERDPPRGAVWSVGSFSWESLEVFSYLDRHTGGSHESKRGKGGLVLAPDAEALYLFGD